MSVWTYLDGSIELSAPIFKTKNSLYNLEKQICEGRSEWSMPTAVDLRAFPVWENKIEKCLTLLPPGEYRTIRHSLTENIDSHFSTSNAPAKVEEYVRTKIFPKLKADEMIFYEYCNNINLSFNANVRYCDCYEMTAKIFEFIKALQTYNIEISRGYLEWTDCGDQHFAMRKDMYGDLKFMILDDTTNAIIAYKTFGHRWNKELKKSEEFVEVSDTWPTNLEKNILPF